MLYVLTLSDTGFFELQKQEGLFGPPNLTFILEQQWCLNLFSSFTNRSRVDRIIRN